MSFSFPNKIIKKSWFSIVLLWAVGLLIYSRILHAPFQFDDYGLMMGNPNIENMHHFLQNWQRLERKGLTFLTFAWNYKIGGHDPFGYHCVNVILHVFNATFLYF